MHCQSTICFKYRHLYFNGIHNIEVLCRYPQKASFLFQLPMDAERHLHLYCIRDPEILNGNHHTTGNLNTYSKSGQWF